MSRGKAYRRRKNFLRKKEVKERMRRYGWSQELIDDPRKVGREASIRGICSCPMCHYGRATRHKRQIARADVDNIKME